MSFHASSHYSVSVSVEGVVLGLRILHTLSCSVLEGFECDADLFYRSLGCGWRVAPDMNSSVNILRSGASQCCVWAWNVEHLLGTALPLLASYLITSEAW